MDVKKNPRKQLDNYSKIFFQLGLVLTLFIIYKTVEYKTYKKEKIVSFVHVDMVLESTEDIPIIKIPEMRPIQKVAAPPPIFEKVKIVEDDIIINEAILESTETNENEAVTKAIITTENIIEVAEVEEIVEDVPFVLIEDVPVYPGCSGNNEQLKACFTKKVSEFFGKKFDIGLASELGLSSGKKKLYVVFKIDKTGRVSNVKASAPHPKLVEEVIAIISSLPQMTPGKQRGVPVGVSYSLPITFEVRE